MGVGVYPTNGSLRVRFFCWMLFDTRWCLVFRSKNGLYFNQNFLRVSFRWSNCSWIFELCVIPLLPLASVWNLFVVFQLFFDASKGFFGISWLLLSTVLLYAFFLSHTDGFCSSSVFSVSLKVIRFLFPIFWTDGFFDPEDGGFGFRISSSGIGSNEEVLWAATFLFCLNWNVPNGAVLPCPFGCWGTFLAFPCPEGSGFGRDGEVSFAVFGLRFISGSFATF